MSAKTVTACLLLFSLVVFLLSGRGQQTLAEDLDEPKWAKAIPSDKLKEDVDFLFKTIEEVHPNMYEYISETEFSKLRDTLYEKINHPMNRLEFYKLVTPVTTSLQNGHLQMQEVVLYEGLRRYTKNGGKVFPLSLVWDRQNAVLDHNAGREPLPLGGIVLTIDGEDASKVIAKLAKYRASEQESGNMGRAGRDMFRYLWFEYGPRESWNVRIKDNEGKAKDYVVKAISIEQLGAEFKKTWWYKLFYNRKENYSYCYLSEYNAGLLEVNTFGGSLSEFEKFLKKTFKEVREQKVSNLIIDIRINGGGSSNLGEALLDYLTDKPWRQFEKGRIKVSVQVGNLEKARQKFPDKKVEIGSVVVTSQVPLSEPTDNPLRFTGRKFVLPSWPTFSAGNSFASAVKCFNIATIIGEETGGTTTAFGEKRFFEMPNSGLQFSVPCKYFVEAGGKPDGRGVIPDYEVKQKPEDTAKGVDTVLQFTLNLIKEKGDFTPELQ